MGSPRAIVSVKATRGGTGASGVGKYIAQSKLDQEREGTQARPLFSDSRDGLTYWAANKLISPDKGGPAKEDIIHLVISTTQEEFDRLGSTQEERLAALREITRDMAKEIEIATQAEELLWFAGIHLNTDNPHVHMAIGRDCIDAETGVPSRIENLPRSLLPHNEMSHDGQKEFTQGEIATRFITSLSIMQNLVAAREFREMSQERSGAHDHTRNDGQMAAREQEQAAERTDNRGETGRERNQTRQNTREIGQEEAQREIHEQEREPDSYQDERDSPRDEPPDRTWKDRYILGRAMVARGEVERLTSALTNARMHGDKRRFRIFDASHDRTRRMSEFDIKRRADARAYREVSDKAILDKTLRHQNRQKLFDEEVGEHDHGIRHHQTILQKTIKKLESDLKEAQQEYGDLRPRAYAIKRDYDTAGKPMPLPLISGKELTKLQNQAVSAKNPTRLNALEQIRQSLIVENKECRRTDYESARVRGQLLMSQTDQKMSERRLEEFEKSRHLTRWDIDGEKWSLADVDKQLAVRAGHVSFFRNPLKHGHARVERSRLEFVRLLNILPSGRESAKAEIKNLTEIRGQVELKIADRRATLQNEIMKAQALTESLSAIDELDKSARLIAGRSVPEPTLTSGELHRLESSALTMKDVQLLKQFQTLETADNRTPSRGKVQMSPEISAGRAVAREIMAEVALTESEQKLADFKLKEKFVPVLVEDQAGRERVASPYEVNPQQRFKDHLVRLIFESKEAKEMRASVDTAVRTQESNLTQEISQAREIYDLAQRTSEHFQQQLGIERPQPIFTPKEINAIEIFSVKQGDAQIGQHYMQIIDAAEKENRVFTTEAEERDRSPLTGAHTTSRDAAHGAMMPDVARVSEESHIEDLDLIH